ncbi:MAG: SHOCT domain-containing protein [Sedimentisphaerales bacterium]|nr:SHOCT domain-containing protein [Sedimentisphaerales bacterium]
MIRGFWLFAVSGVQEAYAVARNGQDRRMDSNAVMNGYGHMMDFWGGHIITWILLLVAVGALVYLFTRASQTHGPSMPSHETPLDILKRRYAQGEITKAQFEEMKKDL